MEYQSPSSLHLSMLWSAINAAWSSIWYPIRPEQHIGTRAGRLIAAFGVRGSGSAEQIAPFTAMYFSLHELALPNKLLQQPAASLSVSQGIPPAAAAAEVIVQQLRRCEAGGINDAY